MKNIGEKLKSSREEKGLSTEEVSEDLKISVNDLNSIENGEKEKFKDNYLLKENIYSYAKYLGLDPDKIIDEFNEFMFEFTSKIPSEVIDRINEQKEEEEKNKEALSPYTMEKYSVNNKKKNLIIIFSIVLIVLIVILILILNSNNSSNVSMLVQ